MKISLNSIKNLNKRDGTAGDIAPDGPEALYEKIGAQLGAIEEVTDIGTRYQGVVIVRIVSCEKHPNADKLNICLVDDGGVTPEVERNENGYVQVVCGAPNVREGLTVAWLPPGSTVPDSTGKEPFILGARELRGVVSNGMLASARELAIGDSHDGIMVLSDDIEPGTAFAKQFDLEGDQVFDIENKMFTHRPDCFGFLGVARELAGIQGLPFKSPAWYDMNAEIPAVEVIENEVLPLEVRNEIPELVPRFCAIPMSNIKVGPSPDWLQIELAKVGQRPINNIVDYTNFFMLETGQPLHAYDYDKVKAQNSNSQNNDRAVIVIRHSQAGEKIKLLNGKEIEPFSKSPEAIMIASETNLIGVGGAMGGADTEVDENTTNIILEVANFNMYSIRRTSMAHGLFTDAVSRFNKGQSPLQNRAVIAKIINEIRTFADGKVAGALIDDNHLAVEMLERGAVHPSVTVTPDYINQRLGLQLTADAMKNLLSNVEFDVSQNGESLVVKAPFWRTDIEIPEDIVEEVGRLYGFDHLPLVLPSRSLTPAKKDRLIETKSIIRASLSKAGANELLTYSFVHGKLLQSVGQDPEQAFKLSNALSPDLQYYRLSLTPSLLDKVHANIRAGYGEFAVFEIGKAHVKGLNDEDGLPKEFERLALVFAADKKAAGQYAGAAYYQARIYLQNVLDACHIDGQISFEAIRADEKDSATAYYEQGRSATVKVNGHILGRIGEYKASVKKALKLPEYCAGFEINVAELSALLQSTITYVKLSRFPRIEQDICLRVSTDMPYRQLYDFVAERLEDQDLQDSHYSLSPVDIFKRDEDADHKQITLRLSIANYNKTLRDSEVTKLLDNVAVAATQTLNAERV